MVVDSDPVGGGRRDGPYPCHKQHINNSTFTDCSTHSNKTTHTYIDVTACAYQDTAYFYSGASNEHSSASLPCRALDDYRQYVCRGIEHHYH